MGIPKKNELVIMVILLINIIVIAVAVFTMFSPNSTQSSIKKADYQQALKYSILFYDANKCGRHVDVDNVFDWRGPCHIDDGKDLNLDFTGGFHDGGDHLKVGINQGYTASILGWSLYTYRDIFDSTGNTKKLLSTLKYFTDYFLKCHTNKSTFYYGIGDVIEDHNYWGPPENQSLDRPTHLVADINHPASDVCGETSAALSIMYLNYRDTENSYALKCLSAAKELYQMGKENRGYAQVQSSYDSGSFYDDLSWAALWLYKAENDKEYLNDAQEFVVKKSKYNNNPLMNNWTLCWDDVSLACLTELYTITKNPKYSDALNYNLNYWKNDLKKTRGGLKYLNKNGVLRYAANASLIAMKWYEITNDKSLKVFAKSQIDYILGANPSKTSYIIGFGKKYPQNVSHRAANGYDSIQQDKQKKSKNVLLGALVSGPSDKDQFIDKVENYEYTEAIIDFNAGLIGALASIIGDAD